MESTDTIQAKRRGLAVLISLGAHLALLLLLWVIHLRSDRPQPKPAEVLVAVNVGNVPLASGDVEPGGTPDVTEPAPQVNPAPATSPKPQPRATPTPPTPKPVAKTPAQTASEQLQTQTHEASLQAEANRRAEAERQAKARAEAELPKLLPLLELQKVNASGSLWQVPLGSNLVLQVAKEQPPRELGTRVTPTALPQAMP